MIGGADEIEGIQEFAPGSAGNIRYLIGDEYAQE
jgi:hypothetical protein